MYFDGFVSGVLGCVCTGAFLLPPWCNLSSESSLYCSILCLSQVPSHTLVVKMSAFPMKRKHVCVYSQQGGLHIADHSE